MIEYNWATLILIALALVGVCFILWNIYTWIEEKYNNLDKQDCKKEKI